LNFDDLIEQAFGMDGIGLIVISDVPEFEQRRFELLKLGHVFAHLAPEIQQKYIHEGSHYSFGWSHGKESLKNNHFDFFKGSYYANPNYDVPTEDPDMIAKYPEVCLPNIWPTDDLPELEPAFKSLGRLICDVGLSLLLKCDSFVKNKLGDDYADGTLHTAIRETRANKARLLHYFPISAEGERDYESWCAWHNDHGLLTGLCPGMFRNEESEEPECDSPDPDAGLYVRTRQGNIQKVIMPRTSLGFQIGLTAQVLTGGCLRATPHAVKACRYPDSATHSRSNLAVFMQPNSDFPITPPPIEYEKTNTEHFTDGMTFGDFGAATIKVFYQGESLM